MTATICESVRVIDCDLCLRIGVFVCARGDTSSPSLLFCNHSLPALAQRCGIDGRRKQISHQGFKRIFFFFACKLMGCGTKAR